MKTKFGLLLVLLVSLGCGTAYKPTEKMSSQELTKHTLEESGVLRGLGGLSQQLAGAKNQAAASAKNPDEVELQNMIFDSMIEAFSYDNLYKPIFKTVHKKMSKKDKVAVISFYRSNTGERVKAIEENMNSQQGQMYFQQWINQINEGTVQIEPDKTVFAQKIAKLTRVTDLAVETTAAMSAGMIVGMNSATPKGKRMSDKDLKMQLKKLKAGLREKLEPAMVLTMYYSYGYMTDENKDNLVKFLESSSGKKYSKILAKAFTKSFSNAAMKVGTKLGRRLASTKTAKN